MKIVRAGLVLAALSFVAACSDNDRGQQYFEAHIDEAEKVVADCRTGTVRGQECVNADMALRVIRGAKLHKQNFGDPSELPSFGNGY